MQEHLLSKRVLAFGRTGMSWQCLEDSVFGTWKKSALTDSTQMLPSPSNMAYRNMVLLVGEDGQNLAHPVMGGNYWIFERPLDEWVRLRDNYVLRNLTNSSDRFSAFSAIPKQFASYFGSPQDYIAGHWRAHLPVDLLWQRGSLVRDRQNTNFPTWSWGLGFDYIC
ncbi:hypothetical protein F4813DRAFT_53630 [Daldinia decipiens]|uniref:uncharacterized protein n=1 Tax=Daldinia decipiens TaxID=326647 RepID=UPI0020C4F0BB|nr:uncharacterized protein F4813DRAFT_53630 [Daldinia decipiens]KAI1658091.1 hypothetical protein F4813DRAFT_53630 [Daldinia decipiens]